MTPEQLRAARNWLGWTQQEMATHASVGLSTIKDFENGKRTPIVNNANAIKTVLEKAGMAFTENAVSGPIATKNPP
jgi:DNA-binding XRE family transcriptional regulator